MVEYLHLELELPVESTLVAFIDFVMAFVNLAGEELIKVSEELLREFAMESTMVLDK
jgi:hypothetical protein